MQPGVVNQALQVSYPGTLNLAPPDMTAVVEDKIRWALDVSWSYGGSEVMLRQVCEALWCPVCD